MRKFVLSGLVALLFAFDFEAGTRTDQVLRGLNLGTNPPNPADVAKHYGYSGEIHTVTTPDGYILDVQRIQNKSVQVSEPLVLVHCITCSSAIWMLQEPANNTAFLLADAGYDVWLANLRGSQFSRNHKQLSPNSAEFWEFGWHEHGVLDMPAIIDYVLNTTGYEQAYYIGYSMGTTTFFVMTSMLPEYNAKIKHMFALSPVAYCGHMQSVIRLFCPGLTFYDDVLRTFLLYNPDAASAKQLVHYGQLVNNPDTFRQFDYGQENWIKYNSSTPPDYPVDQISVPMTFFYSKNDAVSAFEDVEKFSKKLKNVTLYPEKYEKYNHLDFVLSASVNEDVNIPLLKMLQKLHQR